MFVHKSSCHQHNQAAIVCDVGVEHRWTLHLILAFSVASVALMDTNTRVVLIYFDNISVILVIVHHAFVIMLNTFKVYTDSLQCNGFVRRIQIWINSKYF